MKQRNLAGNGSLRSNRNTTKIDCTAAKLALRPDQNEGTKGGQHDKRLSARERISKEKLFSFKDRLEASTLQKSEWGEHYRVALQSLHSLKNEADFSPTP